MAGKAPGVVPVSACVTMDIQSPGRPRGQLPGSGPVAREAVAAPVLPWRGGPSSPWVFKTGPRGARQSKPLGRFISFK